jgi:cytochrome c oxidase subunit 2
VPPQPTVNQTESSASPPHSRGSLPSGPGRWPLAATAFLAVLALTGCSGSELGPPSPVTEQGRHIDGLWLVFAWVAGVIGIIVWALIGWASVRYRRRNRDGLPPQFRYNVPLEIIYTGIPILIVGVLFVLTYNVINRVNALSPNPDVTVEVTGFQWDWQFHYPEYDITVTGVPGQPPVLVLPTDETVRLELTSADVIHSFYVPDFLEKRDVIPGTVEKLDVTITEPGTFQGRCAEFCGVYHDRMTFTVQAVSPDDFAAWAADQTKGTS